jgi:hypothetical protein
MKIRQMLIAPVTPPRPGIPMVKPRSITIHWIGPYPNQEVETPRNWWITGPDGKGIQASAHFIVKEDRVIQCIPTCEVAWHCGSSGNYSSIGIEVIPANLDGVFSAATISTLRELLASLPPLELLRHFDWTKKDCPKWYTPLGKGGDAAWEQLKKELKDDVAKTT